MNFTQHTVCLCRCCVAASHPAVLQWWTWCSSALQQQQQQELQPPPSPCEGAVGAAQYLLQPVDVEMDGVKDKQIHYIQYKYTYIALMNTFIKQ